jgi:NADH-quinone oxidoreductase subunit I
MNWKETDIIIVDQPDLGFAERLFAPLIGGLKITTKHMLNMSKRNEFVVQYPEQTRVSRTENYRGVHRLNRDEQGRVACTGCFMCETACPAHCIHIEADEAPWPDREKYPIKFEIDELRCIYCGMCEEACPVDAIELTTEYHMVGKTRAEMVFDKEKLLAVFDETRNTKPRKKPPITGYTDSH